MTEAREVKISAPGSGVRIFFRGEDKPVGLTETLCRLYGDMDKSELPEWLAELIRRKEGENSE